MLSSWPQPVGSGARRHSLQRHKGRLWTILLIFVHHVVLQGGFNVSLRKVQQDCGDFGSHRSKPRSGVIQPGSWCKAGTHWLSVGNGTPAALCECQGPESGLTSGHLPQGRPTQGLAGDRVPKTGGHHPQNWTGTSLFFEPPMPSCGFFSGPSRCGRSWCVFGSFCWNLLPFGGRGTLSRLTLLSCASTCPSSVVWSMVSPRFPLLWLFLFLLLRVRCRCLPWF